MDRELKYDCMYFVLIMTACCAIAGFLLNLNIDHTL